MSEAENIIQEIYRIKVQEQEHVAENQKGSKIMKIKTQIRLLTLVLAFKALVVFAFLDPNTGRWLNRDPLGDFGSLISVGPLLGQDANVGRMTSDEIADGLAQINGNLFTAVGNNPIGSADLYGLQEICFAQVPPELIQQAIDLNEGRARVNLPDGRAVDLFSRGGRGHFDKATGRDVPTPHTHDPLPPFEPPYESIPRGPNPVPRAATPQDIQDAINYLQGGGGGGGNSSIGGCGNCNVNAPPSQITIPTGTSETPQPIISPNCT